MILNGMGGKRFSRQHAINSARLMNEAQPEYLSTLVVSFPTGMERYQQDFRGEFESLDKNGLFQLLQEHPWARSTVRSQAAFYNWVKTSTPGFGPAPH